MIALLLKICQNSTSLKKLFNALSKNKSKISPKCADCLTYTKTQSKIRFISVFPIRSVEPLWKAMIAVFELLYK